MQNFGEQWNTGSQLLLVKQFLISQNWRQIKEVGQPREKEDLLGKVDLVRTRRAQQGPSIVIRGHKRGKTSWTLTPKWIWLNKMNLILTTLNSCIRKSLGLLFKNPLASATTEHTVKFIKGTNQKWWRWLNF